MCYDIKVLYENALKRAKRKNDPERMKVIEEELKDFKDHEYHHTSGYAHPKIPVYSNLSPNEPRLFNWGLIPTWVKDEQSALSIQNKTLNARIETIFEKPSFREAANNKRCLIYVDGFYEHHHYQGKIYPYFIQSLDQEPICLAGLWDQWVNSATGEIYHGFSIITTKGMGLMKKIHNNPKLSEARMPLFLQESGQERWLSESFNQYQIKPLVSEISSIQLQAHTVKPLGGKYALGNIKQSSQEHIYPELSSSLKLDL